MKLGIMGGSFNPVHLGHLLLADAAISALKLDRIVMIPAYRSPFKLEARGMESTTNDRLEMLAAAVAGDSRFAVDDCEIKREGVSYTVDTVEDIISRYVPTGKPVLIIGDDLADDFLKWQKCEKILQMADIVLGRRLKTRTKKYPFPHTFIDNEIIDISSQMVRQKIGEGKDWRYLVPSGVRAIIEDRHLYGVRTFSESLSSRSPIPTPRSALPGEFSQSFILQVEAAMREALTTERFLHSRNTALLAADLCRRFGLDPSAGYLAGVAHDYAKQLDVKTMMKIAKTDDMPITELEKSKPSLLHGRAAAVLLKERFCIHNEDVLEAVAVHTYGSEDMGQLAKVIYIADKMEMSRIIDPVLRKMCAAEELSSEIALDSIFFAVLHKTISKIQAKALDLSEGTLRLLDRMRERNR